MTQARTVTSASTTVAFTVSETATAVSATAGSAPAAATASSPAAPWGWIAAVLGAVAVACVALLARRRRRQ